MGYGIKIKKLIKDKHTSIKELADASGISLNTLYSITKRDSEKVDISILLKIASCLEIDITELLDPDTTHYMDYMAAVYEYDAKQNIHKMNLSNNLNYLIGHYHVNLSTLANELNVSRDIIEKWVSGEIFPKLHERSLLEKYFRLEDHVLSDEVIIAFLDNENQDLNLKDVLGESFNKLSYKDKEALKNYIEFLNKTSHSINNGTVISRLNNKESIDDIPISAEEEKKYDKYIIDDEENLK